MKYGWIVGAAVGILVGGAGGYVLGAVQGVRVGRVFQAQKDQVACTQIVNQVVQACRDTIMGIPPDQSPQPQNSTPAFPQGEGAVDL